jgi:hypothetical protein
MSTYRDGVLVTRSFVTRRRPSADEVRQVGLSMVGLPVLRGQGATPAGGIRAQGLAYSFYERLGLFIPFALQEQAIYGFPVSLARAQPGDLIVLGGRERGAPASVAIALGDGSALLADARAGSVVRSRIATGRRPKAAGLPGRPIVVRRILDTPWEGYLGSAPAEVLALASHRARAPASAWSRIRGVASFYDHLGSEEVEREGTLEEESRALSFVPSAVRSAAVTAPAGAHRYTLAHGTLPMGTRARVTCPETGRSVECVVTDRGSFESDRSFEVCFEAAQALGLDRLGAAVVDVDVLSRSGAGAGAGASGRP